MAGYEIKDGVGIIPEGKTKIEEEAFEKCTELTSIVIPDSVTEIEESAFERCTGLTSIVIPDSVTKIGKWAFYGCTGLTTASVLGPVKLMYRTFRDCTALESVTLGVGIKKLLIYDIDYEEECCAFDDCTALKTINVPAKKADYYKKRLPESLHGLIVELPAEKKAKAKKTAKKVIKGGKVEVTIQGHLKSLRIAASLQTISCMTGKKS